MQDFSPSLRPDATLRIIGQNVELEIEDFVYNVSGAPVNQLLLAMTAMNGVLDLSDIERQSGLSLEILEPVVNRLVEVGAINKSSSPPSPYLSAEKFNHLCRRLYKQWKIRLFSHPLWVGLAEGSLPREVFIGWVVESWWFISGVQNRLPMAIALTENRTMRSFFTRHFSEEWDHFHFFARALDSLDITSDQRMQSKPLPATAAIQHWMRMSARMDSLRYATCSGFLESTGSDRITAKTFFNQIEGWYDCEASGGVKPMADHVALDEEYGHGSCVEKITLPMGKIERQRACAAIQNAFGLVETLEMWSTDILRHYQSPNALPLRAARCYRGTTH